MAVKVTTGGVFTKAPGQRPGLYVRFIERAIAAIGSGARSKVATLKSTFSGTAVANKVYRVTNMEQATSLFGDGNVKDIAQIFTGGASEVVVSTAGTGGTINWSAALQALETYEFHVYVNPVGGDTALATASFTWLKTCKTNGMSFIGVFADKASEGTVTSVKAAATGFDDEYAVFVGGGVLKADGTKVEADEYACYIAGLIAGTPLDGSLTYLDVPFAEPITRYRSVDVIDLLAAGVLVTVMDGDKPRIEQGLTLGEGTFSKIRTVRAKQALVDDISRTVNDSYIGKITNNANGQVAVINAIKAYLTTLATANVIDTDFIVELDPTQPSVGSDLYILVGVRFLDSIEYVYMTISN
jgi:hypothetical protein